MLWETNLSALFRYIFTSPALARVWTGLSGIQRCMSRLGGVFLEDLGSREGLGVVVIIFVLFFFPLSAVLVLCISQPSTSSSDDDFTC
jgi:hypothetical protein